MFACGRKSLLHYSNEFDSIRSAFGCIFDDNDGLTLPYEKQLGCNWIAMLQYKE